MSWDKLCVRKEDGGLGFRDLKAFNLALLGKQGWKFVSDRDALVTRLFKAKYFPRGDFLTAAVGHNPSFTWRSIWNSQALLREGARWIIGDGSKINVWEEPWLRGGDQLGGSSDVALAFPGLRVQDLISLPNKCLNVQVIGAIFEEEDAARILDVPIFKETVVDRLAWKFNKQGSYSVRSGYRLCMEVFSDQEQLKVAADWSKLWHLDVPPKVKTFLWRSCRDCLPTRVKLRTRGVNCSSICAVCNAALETTWHSLITCPSAKECWEQLGIWNFIDSHLLVCENFRELFFALVLVLDAVQVKRFVMTLWSTWTKRNTNLWEGRSETRAEVIHRGQTLYYMWELAQNTRNHHVVGVEQTPPIVKWISPPPGVVKCNLDAAFDPGSSTTGFGLCLRVAGGHFWLAKMEYTQPLLSVMEGETMALLIGLRWLANMGLDHAIFETDCKGLVDRLHSTMVDHTELGDLIFSCKYLLRLNPHFKVQFVKRQANGVAHALARVSATRACSHVFSYLPDCILSIIINEMS